MDAGLGFRTGTAIGGFVTNPSFEDGSVGTMTKNVSLNNWMLGGIVLVLQGSRQAYNHQMFITVMALML